eukprot:548056-Prorocentrum_lima.AAC.1
MRSQYSPSKERVMVRLPSLPTMMKRLNSLAHTTAWSLYAVHAALTSSRVPPAAVFRISSA